MTQWKEPCLCGAPDCAHCFPGSWWHLEDCDGTDECGCPEPYDDSDLGPEDTYDYDSDPRFFDPTNEP